MTSLRDSDQSRANNYPVKLYFLQLKRQVKEARIGDPGKVPIGQYVMMLQNDISAVLKKNEFTIPDRGRTNKRRLELDSLTDDGAALSQE
jgi:hypothetical protein